MGAMLTRRTFTTGFAGPLILKATDKSGSQRPILGDGDHKYEVFHDCGILLASIRYGNTHGVCEDSQGRIYIQHTVHAWPKLSTEPREKFVAGKFICPHSACFDHAGNIFVVEWVEVGRVTKLKKVS